jgi:hypothetical protein
MSNKPNTGEVWRLAYLSGFMSIRIGKKLQSYWILSCKAVIQAPFR